MAPLFLRAIALALLFALSGVGGLVGSLLADDCTCDDGGCGEDEDGCCFACSDCAHRSLGARTVIADAQWSLPPPSEPTLLFVPAAPTESHPASGVVDDVFHPPRT